MSSKLADLAKITAHPFGWTVIFYPYGDLNSRGLLETCRWHVSTRGGPAPQRGFKSPLPQISDKLFEIPQKQISQNFKRRIVGSIESTIRRFFIFGGDFEIMQTMHAIPAELNRSRSTVKRALHDLEKHGYIRRLPRYRESGSRSSNLYVLVDD